MTMIARLLALLLSLFAVTAALAIPTWKMVKGGRDRALAHVDLGLG